MKLLITGGAGKVGQGIVSELLDNPAYEITVLDRTPGPGPVEVVVGDIQDFGQVMEAMAGAEAVMHLAAIHNPNIAPTTVTYQTNVMGTFNVHHAASVSASNGSSRPAAMPSSAGATASASCPTICRSTKTIRSGPRNIYGLSKEIGDARSYARKGVETVMLRPSGVVTPEELENIKKDGGRKPTGFYAYSYIDARDLAVAFRLAVERSLPSGTVLFVVADDSTVAEPLCDLYPRIMPAIGDKARNLTGSKGAYSNARAKKLLGWQPAHYWR